MRLCLVLPRSEKQLYLFIAIISNENEQLWPPANVWKWAGGIHFWNSNVFFNFSFEAEETEEPISML